MFYKSIFRQDSKSFYDFVIDELPNELYTQNAFEQFNKTYRESVLDAYVFNNLIQVRNQSSLWMENYNNHIINPFKFSEGFFVFSVYLGKK